MADKSPEGNNEANSTSCITQGDSVVKHDDGKMNRNSSVMDTVELELEREKRKIREEIVASEIRRQELEAEVRMELMMERQVMGASGDNLGERMNPMAQPTSGLDGLMQITPHPHANNVSGLCEEQEIQESSLPISTSSIVGIKRKAETLIEASGNETAPTASEDSQKKWYCSLCEVMCTSEGTLNTHLQGKKHKTKMAKSQSDDTNAPPPLEHPISTSSEQETNPVTEKKWHCSLCQVFATSETLLKAHLQGKRHKAKEAKLGIDKNSSNVDYCNSSGKSQGVAEMKKWYCSVCLVSASSEENLQAHLRGKKHRAKAGPSNSDEKVSEIVEDAVKSNLDKEQETIDMAVDPEEDRENVRETANRIAIDKYWHCNLCDEVTRSEVEMAAHRRSSDHMTLLRKNGGGLIVVSRVPVEGGKGA